jgi:hypothetical protein
LRERLDALPDALKTLSILPAIDRWRVPLRSDARRFDTLARTAVVDEALVLRWIGTLRARR